MHCCLLRSSIFIKLLVTAAWQRAAVSDCKLLAMSHGSDSSLGRRSSVFNGSALSGRHKMLDLMSWRQTKVAADRSNKRSAPPSHARGAA